jgi:hypothetical protein
MHSLRMQNYALSKEYLDRLDKYDKAHKNLWDQYLALQAAYNEYIDSVNKRLLQ